MELYEFSLAVSCSCENCDAEGSLHVTTIRNSPLMSRVSLHMNVNDIVLTDVT